jgi:hypothetical protein
VQLFFSLLLFPNNLPALQLVFAVAFLKQFAIFATILALVLPKHSIVAPAGLGGISIVVTWGPGLRIDNSLLVLQPRHTHWSSEVGRIERRAQVE